MTVVPVIKKVPGETVKFNHEKDGYLNLSSISKIELLDLLGREEKLLKNKNFIAKLPDKGEKIGNFYNRVKNELKKREENEKLCNLLSNLNVTDSKSALDSLEWTGDSKISPKHEVSVDDDSNLFKILATHSSTNVSKEKILKTEDDTSPIRLSGVGQEALKNIEVDLYAQQLCQRFDKSNKNEKKKFYPNKSLNKSFTKRIPSAKEPESSSAYVPKNISGQTKLLSLEESIVIHQEQIKQLKEIEMQRTVEKLIQKTKMKLKIPTNSITDYRERNSDDSDEHSSETTCENSEDEDEDDGAAVYFNENDE